MGFLSRRVILVLLCVLLAFLIFYGLVLFPKQRTREDRTKAIVARLNSEIESAQKTLERERKRVQELLDNPWDFHFIRAEEKPLQARIPAMLQEIQRISGESGVAIQTIEPLKEEVFDNYTRYPFSMTFLSDYRGFVRFVGGLENDLNLNLDEFSVEFPKESQKPPEGRFLARCLFNAYELKDKEVLNLMKVQAARKKKERSRAALAFKRDPFQRPMEIKKAVAFVPVSHHLQGIMKWGKSYQAIIDNKIYQVGDWVGKNRIIDITEDRVVFDNKTSPLVLKRSE